MSKYKEGISEARKEKKMYWEVGIQQFSRDLNFKLFRPATIKTKTRVCVPSACLQREVFGELISAARVAGKETGLQFIRIITWKQELRNREGIRPSGCVSTERYSLEISAATEKYEDRYREIMHILQSQIQVKISVYDSKHVQCTDVHKQRFKLPR